MGFIRNNPDKVRAETERYDRFLPGTVNSIVARVRYFDDIVKKSIDEDLNSWSLWVLVMTLVLIESMN